MSNASSAPSNVSTLRSASDHSRQDDGLLDGDLDDLEHANLSSNALPSPGGTRVWAIRALALLCACSLSVGSHFGREFLGPLKSRLAREIGSSNVEFSILIASYSLNNTWTPFVGGLLASKLGTTLSSIIATSIILCGQAILLLGRETENLGLMATGLFIFGLGVSPLAVVQETIIVRFFAKHGLGVSLAFGLLAGKGASFFAAFTSYPLSEHFGPQAPFIVSTLLAFFSVIINVAYIFGSKWLAKGAGVELDEDDAEPKDSSRVILSENAALRIVTEKRTVRFEDVSKLGDIFWVYIAMNFLSGAIWSTFTHLAANIIQLRYGYTEAEASRAASFLHAGSIVLYPICGFLTDRFRNTSTVHLLFLVSSVLTLLCYMWLILPPTLTKTAMPAIVLFGTGHGFATLLLVIIVPRIVPLKYVSTALGAHKSLEQTGATISQTLAGLLLDSHKKSQTADPTRMGALIAPQSQQAIQNVLLGFFFVNLLQLGSIIWLWRLDSGKREVHDQSYIAVPDSEHEGNDAREEVESYAEVGAATTSLSDDHRLRRLSNQPLLPPQQRHRTMVPLLDPGELFAGRLAVAGEQRRGQIFVWISEGVVLFCWVFFLGTVVHDVHQRKT